MARFRWHWTTSSSYVTRIRSSVKSKWSHPKLLISFDPRCHNLTLILYRNTLQWRSTMAMVGVRFCWLDWRGDLVEPERIDCKFVFLCLALKLLISFDPRYHNLTLILLSKYTTMAMVGVHFCWLNWRDDLVEPERIGGNFVLLCLVLKLLIEFAPRCHNLTLILLSKYTTMAMVGVRLSWLSKYTTMVMTGARFCWLNRWDDLVEPWRIEGKCILLCLTLKLLISFDPRCHNLTLILHRNILQWQWSVCVYLGYMNERSCWPWINSR